MDSYEEVVSSREVYRELPEDIEYFKKYYSNGNLKFGDFFLYQTISDNHMTYPKLAVFIGYNFADMALVYQFVNSPRTWMNNVKFCSNEKLNRYSTVSEYGYSVTDFIEWGDEIYIFKIWKSMPNWKELKKYYKKTMWYDLGVIENRNKIIKGLLNN